MLICSKITKCKSDIVKRFCWASHACWVFNGTHVVMTAVNRIAIFMVFELIFACGNYANLIVYIVSILDLLPIFFSTVSKSGTGQDAVEM